MKKCFVLIAVAAALAVPSAPLAGQSPAEAQYGQEAPPAGTPAPPAPPAPPVVASGSGQLPFTGFAVLTTVLLGIGMFGTGLTLYLCSRERVKP